MTNPHYYTYRVLKAGFNINLDSHHINQLYFKLTITPNYLEVGKNFVNNKLK